MTSVLVTCPIGSASFPRATADVFAPHVLTITSLETDAVLRTFGIDQWSSVIVIDDRTGKMAFMINMEARIR